MNTEAEGARPKVVSPAVRRLPTATAEKSAGPKAYVVRLGTFMIAAPCETPKKSDILGGLREALKAESRVAELDFTEQRPHWMRRTTFYPATPRPTTEMLLSGSDHFHNVVLSDPIRFTVKVPKKNQPGFMGYSDHPSDTYFVAWDGLTVAVSWEVSPELRRISRAGGQVVADILGECSRKAGLDLYVQACHPGCKNLFTHTDLFAVEVANTKHPTISDQSGPGSSVRVDISAGDSGLEAVEHVAHWLRQDFRYFARFKNFSQRLIDLDRASQAMVEELLEIQHSRNTRRSLGWLTRARAWRRSRGDKRKIRSLVSSLWLASARHESLLSQWHTDHDSFIDSSSEHDTGRLFKTDLVQDERAVARQDLAFITNAVTQTSSTLDARLIALVTLVGGLSALLGALLAAAWS